MARSPWYRETVVVRGKTFVDHVERSGAHRIEQGRNHEEARAGRPYCLVARPDVDAGFFATVAEAKRAAKRGPAAVQTSAHGGE